MIPPEVQFEAPGKPWTRAALWKNYGRLQEDCLTGKNGYKWHEIERWLGRNDLFYLLVRILRRGDLNKDWLFERCREVQADPNGYLDLWAREHGKSSIITFGLTIQDILRDPEITVGIFSHTRPIAKAFLSQIKREFEDNAVLKGLYPDILWQAPHKESPRWAEDAGIIVKRKGNPKEATIEAWGLVDGQPTGRHFSHRIYDDVVTRESVTTPEMIKKVTDAWDLSQNLGVEGGVVRYIGTRYHLGDTYAEILKRGAAEARYHAATHNGRIDGRPVLFSEKTWSDRVRHTSRPILAAQMLQNPLADEDAMFLTQWLRPYETRPRTLNVYIMCDPSLGRSAESDNTAIAVIGVARGGAKFLLDGACHRMTLSQKWTMLRNLYRKWSRARGVQHVAVGYERYGMQTDLEYFAEQMALAAARKEAMAYFPIEELNWVRDGGQSKRERVERLEPDFRNGRFFIPLPVWCEVRVDGASRKGPATWSVDRDPESRTFGVVSQTPAQGLTKAQMEAMEGGSADLVCSAIRQVDQDGRLYDVTLWFIDEYSQFPYYQFKDFLDAASRVYDMNPVEPTISNPERTAPAAFWDS